MRKTLYYPLKGASENGYKIGFREFMADPNYKFGKAMINIGNFYSECGQIEPENLPNVVASFAPELLQQALGIEFEVAG